MVVLIKSIKWHQSMSVLVSLVHRKLVCGARVGGDIRVSTKQQQRYPHFSWWLLWLPSFGALESRRLRTGGDCCWVEKNHSCLYVLGKLFTLSYTYILDLLGGLKTQMSANHEAQCVCSVVGDCHHQPVFHNDIFSTLQYMARVCSISIWWVNEIVHHSISQRLLMNIPKILVLSGRALLLSLGPSLWVWAWI